MKGKGEKGTRWRWKNGRRRGGPKKYIDVNPGKVGGKKSWRVRKIVKGRGERGDGKRKESIALKVNKKGRGR